MSIVTSKYTSKYAPYIFCDDCGAKLLLPMPLDQDKVPEAMEDFCWSEKNGRHICKPCSLQLSR